MSYASKRFPEFEHNLRLGKQDKNNETNHETNKQNKNKRKPYKTKIRRNLKCHNAIACEVTKVTYVAYHLNSHLIHSDT